MNSITGKVCLFLNQSFTPYIPPYRYDGRQRTLLFTSAITIHANKNEQSTSLKATFGIDTQRIIPLYFHPQRERLININSANDLPPNFIEP